MVDAFDGPIPAEARFVTKNLCSWPQNLLWLSAKLTVTARALTGLLTRLFDLFVNLDADEQLDFPIIYASALNGIAGLDHEDMAEDMTRCIRAIIDHVRRRTLTSMVRCEDADISQLVLANCVGVVGIGGIRNAAKVKPNQQVTIIDSEGKTRLTRK